MQVVAHGAQDLYLSANPQVTFFKAAYRRHTNFATESLEQPFSGTSDFGRKVTCELQRSGDLVTKMYVRVQLPSYTATDAEGKWGWCSRVGHALLHSIELDVGGIKIDKWYGDMLNIWYELARNFAHDRGYDQMIGNTAELTALEHTHNEATLWIPLQFSCCRNDGLALPVIALQYHEIRINIEFRELAQLVNRNNKVATTEFRDLHMGDASLYVEYVYLDNDERKRFAQASHEYLFEQVQFTGEESVTNTNAKFRLNLNHPVKNLMWFARHNDYVSCNKFLAVPTAACGCEKARELATKRYVLSHTADTVYGWTGASDTKAWITGGDLTTTGSATTDTRLNEIKGLFINPAIYDVDNIVITGRLLTLEEMSTVVSTLVTNPAAGVVGDGHRDYDVCVYQWDNYGVWLDGSGNPTQQALLQLNGHDRFTEREGMYFNYVQPWQCNSNTPCDGLNTYSFALQPEDHQPSGTCNFSRIDNATLKVTFHNNFKNSNANISIYAMNINIFRVMSGMGGVAYSN